MAYDSEFYFSHFPLFFIISAQIIATKSDTDSSALLTNKWKTWKASLQKASFVFRPEPSHRQQAGARKCLYYKSDYFYMSNTAFRKTYGHMCFSSPHVQQRRGESWENKHFLHLYLLSRCLSFFIL